MPRVIIVEDEGIVAKSMAKMLALHGHEVPASLATGGEAVAAALSLSPDLVLMDIHLKGTMDGIEAARQIRAARDIPIVFLTAYSDRDHLDRAKLTEPYAYLLKPYSDRELLTTIEVVVHKHRLERELRDRERWLGTTLRSIGDGVVAVGADQRVVLVNAEAERLTGWANRDAVGRPITEVLQLRNEETGAPRDLPLGAAMRDGTVLGLDGPTLLVDRSGAELPIEDSVAAIVDDHGVVLGGVVVFRDVTERRLLEARLSLADRMASFTTFTAGLGHELNNPLSYNLGNLEMLLHRLPALRQQVEHLPGADSALTTLRELEDHVNDALAGASRMRELLGTLRSFARSDAEPQTFSVIDPLESAIRLTSNEIGLRGTLTREYRQRPFVRGNAGQLCQVFTNLLTNAAQALTEGAASGQNIRVIVDATERDATVEIMDNGAGIPGDVMLRIFEPFFTTKPLGLGTGLGLAVVHNITQAHGGAVTVASKLGEGTAFRVAIPRERVPTAVATKAASGARASLLVVDDDPIVNRMLRRVLEPHHDVTMVESGRDALAAISKREFDVVLSDLMMPGMTGIQLHESVLAYRPAVAERMLFLTGGAFTPATQAFVAAMGARVLYKPISKNDLLVAIAAVLERR